MPRAAMASRKSKPKRPKLVAPELAREAFARLRERHADAHCELVHGSPFELIVATVLSAQTTDVMVNQTTPELFRRWPTPEALANAKPSEVERVVGSLGFFRQKTKSIMGLSKLLVEEHGGEVPKTLAELDLRRRAGATVIAVVRGEESRTNPPADFRFEVGDDLVLVGSHAEIDAAFALLEGETAGAAVVAGALPPAPDGSAASG